MPTSNSPPLPPVNSSSAGGPTYLSQSFFCAYDGATCDGSFPCSEDQIAPQPSPDDQIQSEAARQHLTQEFRILSNLYDTTEFPSQEEKRILFTCSKRIQELFITIKPLPSLNSDPAEITYSVFLDPTPTSSLTLSLSPPQPDPDSILSLSMDPFKNFRRRRSDSGQSFFPGNGISIAFLSFKKSESEKRRCEAIL